MAHPSAQLHITDTTFDELQNTSAAEGSTSINAAPEAPPRRCIKCGLINPATASRCDCGQDFKNASTPEMRWEIKRTDGSVYSCKEKQDVLDAIMAGEVKRDWECRCVPVAPAASQTSEPKWKSIERSFALFRPMRHLMWTGGGIGAGIGLLVFLALKAGDAALAGFAYGIPKLIGVSLVYVFWLSMLTNGYADLLPASMKKSAKALTELLTKGVFIGGILLTINMGTDVLSGVLAGLSGVFVTVIIGSLLGGLPGLAIGSCVGLVRRGSLPIPPGAQKESGVKLVICGVLLPLALLAACIVAYVIYVLPWANQALVNFVKK